MSNTRNLFESFQKHLNENELLTAVKSIFDKNAKQTAKSISVYYNNADLWITDAGKYIKLDTKKDKGTILHTNKGDMNGPSIHLKVEKSNNIYDTIKKLKNDFDKSTSIDVENKYIVYASNLSTNEEGYLSDDKSIVNRDNAKVYSDKDSAEHDLINLINDNKDIKGKVEEI